MPSVQLRNSGCARTLVLDLHPASHAGHRREAGKWNSPTATVTRSSSDRPRTEPRRAGASQWPRVRIAAICSLTSGVGLASPGSAARLVALIADAHADPSGRVWLSNGMRGLGPKEPSVTMG